MAGRFEPRHAGDPARLIAAYPLGWLVSASFNASPLPLLAETGADGAIVSLFGHCARNNPLVADFRTDPRGLILFNGPRGYVSPSLLSKPDWAPTWNYAVLRYRVEVELVEGETREAIERLVDAMEHGNWSTERVGPRYETMLTHIVAFRAHVRSAEPAYKLGQDESAEGFAEIVAGHPNRVLAEWMEGQR
ncbi:hypothetical protein BWQ93_08440 [Sphingopyxis sp. QXT-31]|uniref:FMN-binding negative transcriptional regulator n=1 Tax=Sphingopyxis sp. QXT-31 TaxID=1357916 RepID=UPI00097935A7|nr:FMN-binding negative transcriptional regulator [Sphingopyxis sp. QXT-31]APZ98520.1 hypothetical protein BWQ93_08440 [Sphingopyxis sp. QXT-31]